MNYIWELAINAITNDIDPDSIFFYYGNPFSGYMELSFPEMNETGVPLEVEINPFYRYYRIFRELFEPNANENPEMIEVIHDITIHHLKDIDVLMGMNKREYHIEFVIEDMEKGLFGDFAKDRIGIFSRLEQKTIANNLLRLYETSECVYLLKDTINQIFKKSYVFSNAKEKDEIILFLRTKQTKEKREMVRLITHLFLPFKYGVEIYWENIFGIIGVDEFMIMDKMLIY